jgi:hypothetical protein
MYGAIISDWPAVSKELVQNKSFYRYPAALDPHKHILVVDGCLTNNML